jgi:hypothetical protein
VILAIFIGFVLIFFYCIIFVYQSKADFLENNLLQLDNWKSMDPQYFLRKGELEISVPFEQAFRLSKLAVPLLPSAKIIDENPDVGMIHAATETISGGISMIRFTFEKKGMNSTRIHIQSSYIEYHLENNGFLSRFGGPKGVMMDTGQNEKTIATLTKYIQEQSQE